MTYKNDKREVNEMKVIKRDGHMVDYCPEKIEQAIMKANNEVEEEDQASSTQIKNIIKRERFASIKDCMGFFKELYTGLYDGKTVSKLYAMK